MFKKSIILLISCCLLCGCSLKEKETINVLNWSSYIPDEVIRSFEEETGIQVNYATYSSNEELLAKVSAVKEGTYDLVFPSDYMVEILHSRDMLKEIDASKLENYVSIDPQFLGLSFDPENKYSIPFLSANVVLAVNKDMVSDAITSYKDLVNPSYKESIVLLDDTRVVIGVALLASGYDMNETDESALQVAQAWLEQVKPNIKAYDSDSPKSFLITKEASIGLMWSAEAILAKEENPNIEIILPEEGYNVSLDNFAIVKGTKKEEAVYKFIDYILSYKVMSSIVENYPYASVNLYSNRETATKSFGAEYTRMLKAFSKGTRVENIGSAIRLYDEIWAYIK